MARIRIFVGSIFGGALMTARALQKELGAAEHEIHLAENPVLDDFTGNNDAILICTSTTGQGELPDSLIPLYSSLRDQLPQQQNRPFGMIVLGDSSYGDTFCGAGELMEEVLYETACRKLGDTLRIDALETTEPEHLAIPWAADWARLVENLE